MACPQPGRRAGRTLQKGWAASHMTRLQCGDAEGKSRAPQELSWRDRSGTNPQSLGFAPALPPLPASSGTVAPPPEDLASWASFGPLFSQPLPSLYTLSDPSGPQDKVPSPLTAFHGLPDFPLESHCPSPPGCPSSLRGLWFPGQSKFPGTCRPRLR